MHDKRCELFACPTLLAKPYLCVAEVGAWHVEPSDDLSWSVIMMSLITRTPRHTFDVQALVEFCPCLQENHGNDGLSLRPLFGLRKRWQWIQAIQQVLDMRFPAEKRPHLESEPRSRHCPCRWPVYLELVSHVFLEVARINGVTAAVIFLSIRVHNLFKRVPLCGRSSSGLMSGPFCCISGSGVSPTMIRPRR